MFVSEAKGLRAVAPADAYIVNAIAGDDRQVVDRSSFIVRRARNTRVAYLNYEAQFLGE